MSAGRSTCTPSHTGRARECRQPRLENDQRGLFRDMKPNRSIPHATVIPVLIYPDVRQAVDWLSKAYGFSERLRIGENHRSQMNVGDGAVIHAPTTGEQVRLQAMGYAPIHGYGRPG